MAFTQGSQLEVSLVPLLQMLWLQVLTGATHWPLVLQVEPEAQVPQLPPQPSLPQVLPEQLGVQVVPPQVWPQMVPTSFTQVASQLLLQQ